MLTSQPNASVDPAGGDHVVCLDGRDLARLRPSRPPQIRRGHVDAPVDNQQRVRGRHGIFRYTNAVQILKAGWSPRAFEKGRGNDTPKIIIFVWGGDTWVFERERWVMQKRKHSLFQFSVPTRSVPAR